MTPGRRNPMTSVLWTPGRRRTWLTEDRRTRR
jgi:hypothetical protein